MKQCVKCKEIKNFSEFFKCKGNKSGVQSYCKICCSKGQKEFFRTKDGLAVGIYNRQKQTSKHRNHLPPFYIKQELKDWLFSQDLFHKLYKNWVKFGYNKWLIPSVDRKNDNLPYSFDNIQLMTWKQNKDKSHEDTRSGKLIHGAKPHKPVLQYDKQGNFIAEYVSGSQAERETGIGQSRISATCRNKQKTAGGYKWNFK